RRAPDGMEAGEGPAPNRGGAGGSCRIVSVPDKVPATGSLIVLRFSAESLLPRLPEVWKQPGLQTYWYSRIGEHPTFDAARPMLCREVIAVRPLDCLRIYSKYSRESFSKLPALPAPGRSDREITPLSSGSPPAHSRKYPWLSRLSTGLPEPTPILNPPPHAGLHGFPPAAAGVFSIILGEEGRKEGRKDCGGKAASHKGGNEIGAEEGP
ncbi:MAG: hypothetical protein LUE10_02935, partial [Alistipes sp.]|nr:hypothetical protein [Alistipes sp.]